MCPSGLIIGLKTSPLCFSVEDIIPHEALWIVANVISPLGEWNLNCIQTTITGHVLDRIKQTRLSNIVNTEDKIQWKSSSNGIISSKSFFKFLAGEDEEDSGIEWKRIWKVDCLQKLRLVMHKRLPTNVYYNRIGMEVDNKCGRCQIHKESMDHLLRYCLNSMDVWKALIPQLYWDWFFGTEFEVWLKANLNDENRIGLRMNKY